MTCDLPCEAESACAARLRRAARNDNLRHHDAAGGEEMARLTGKVALITGAAGGQGTTEAELFVREEAAVVLTDIDAAAGESLAQRLAGEGGKILFLRQDVADEGSWKEVVAAALGRFGKLHVLVNNAGTIARQGIADTTVD